MLDGRGKDAFTLQKTWHRRSKARGEEEERKGGREGFLRNRSEPESADVAQDAVGSEREVEGHATERERGRDTESRAE